MVAAAPPPVSEQVMGVSSGLDQVLRRALSIEPAERYARIEEFMSALREVSDPGAVWDDGATVIWSPAAGDMEPPMPPPMSAMDDYMPPLRPRQRTNTAKIRSLRLTGGAARVMKSAADAISHVVGSVGKRRQDRGQDQGQDESLRALMPKSRTATPPTGGVGEPLAAGSASGLSGVTPMAFASFPTSAIPSRRTQVVFLGAAVVMVLAAVAVMSGSRVKPATDSASADNAVAEPEPIRPRPRIVEMRPVARTAPVASKIPSAAATSGSAAIVAVATPTPRHPSKPARAHSRHAGAHRTARR